MKTNMDLDGRTRYTKKLLKRALLALLAEKPIAKIKVNELCEKAGINRATFYRHFSCCEDLLDCIKQDFLNDFIKSLDIEDWTEPDAIIHAVFKSIDENKDLCDVLAFNTPTPALFRFMLDVSYEHCIPKWQATIPAFPREDMDLLFDFIASGTSSIIHKYFNTVDHEKLIRFIVKRVNDHLDPYRATDANL